MDWGALSVGGIQISGHHPRPATILLPTLARKPKTVATIPHTEMVGDGKPENKAADGVAIDDIRQSW